MEKLTALRVFRRVAELGSFTRAAKDLRISNAAASKNVRELEEELGVPLVQRTTRRLNLTPAGQKTLASMIRAARGHERVLDGIIGARDRARFLEVLKRIAAQVE